MASIGVSLKINVSKIDKARLFEGKKGKYLDCTAFIDLDAFSEYGDSGMITQDVTKEEKEAGTKGAILGSSKIFWSDRWQQPSHAAPPSKAPPGDDDLNFDDDIPF